MSCKMKRLVSDHVNCEVILGVRNAPVSTVVNAAAEAGGDVDGAVKALKGTERHEIALEPHWFRVQTERIKRCNSQAKKDY
ncbi:BQ5605_C011g06336 [Microbotryum silenes-dioicae]|uniref:BQ5605_C011g06336 protein n=1 Tax=Microbotryum silenes-dioicae TaxID=796604 RepID=A0A2X0LNR8_9BASI|nr:BQ5605_C011g06336 [Microbotryum silenes-dioicae]